MTENAKSNLTAGIIYAAGMLSGAGIALVLVKLAYKNTLEERMEKEIEELLKDVHNAKLEKEDYMNFKRKLKDDRTKSEKIIDGPIKEEEEDVNYIEIVPDNYTYPGNTNKSKDDEGEDKDDVFEDNDAECWDVFDDEDEPIYNPIELEGHDPEYDRNPFIMTEGDVVKELREHPDYTVSYWTIYNGPKGHLVLADDTDELVTEEQCQDILGISLSGVFKLNEEDLVYVINDRLELVVEISEDLSSYAEIKRTMPFITW